MDLQMTKMTNALIFCYILAKKKLSVKSISQFVRKAYFCTVDAKNVRRKRVMYN